MPSEPEARTTDPFDLGVNDPETGHLRTENGLALRSLTAGLASVSKIYADSRKMNSTDVRAILAILEADRTGETLGPTQLAERLGISTASVSALADRLESGNHLERVAVPGDRRRVVLVVGDETKRSAREYFGALQARIATATSDMSRDDLVAVNKYLSHVLSAIQEHLEASAE